jgi:hypothetical protein
MSDRVSVRLATRRAVGGCLACAYDEQATKVWVILLGMVEVRVCDRHLRMICQAAKRLHKETP